MQALDSRREDFIQAADFKGHHQQPPLKLPKRPSSSSSYPSTYVSDRSNKAVTFPSKQILRTSGAALPVLAEEKAELVSGLLAAKEASGKSFTNIANELGLTNAYVANLFMNQARLTEELTPALQAAVPGLTAQQLAAMQRCPMRSFNEAILQVAPGARTHRLRTVRAGVRRQGK